MDFFATARGKGACDALAGTVASRGSLQFSSDEQNLNPKSLYIWCKIHILNVKFFFKTQNDYDDTAKFLTPRVNTARCDARLPRSEGIPYIFKACEKKSLCGICPSVWHHRPRVEFHEHNKCIAIPGAQNKVITRRYSESSIEDTHKII